MSESLMSLEELLSATKGTLLGKVKSCVFNSVATDSRQVQKNTLFVPLVGEFQDGHKYVPGAVAAGASVVLINKSEYEKNSSVYDLLTAENENLVIICVENTLHGLQDAAEGYVAKFPKLIKVSITGSCGKTTTKEMMVSVAKAHFGEDKVVYTKGNFNSETGLPLSVFQIRANHVVGIFELGMNRVDEIGEISKVLKSKYGIITNIGNAHIGILGSRENIALEKRKSFNYIPVDGACFVPSSDDFADYCTENVKGKVIKFPYENDGVVFVSDNGLFGSTFTVDGVEVNLPLSGAYNYTNALGVIACAKELGIGAEEIKSGLENMAAVSGRMEIKKLALKNGANIMLVKDCYNANPDSMKKSVEFCGGLKNVGKKIFVLGDMKELGAESVKAHTELGEEVKASGADYVYLVGNEIECAYEVLTKINDKSAMWFEQKGEETFNQISDDINSYAKEEDVILLKGSHSMELEKLIPLMAGGEEK